MDSDNEYVRAVRGVYVCLCSPVGKRAFMPKSPRECHLAQVASQPRPHTSPGGEKEAEGP